MKRIPDHIFFHPKVIKARVALAQSFIRNNYPHLHSRQKQFILSMAVGNAHRLCIKRFKQLFVDYVSKQKKEAVSWDIPALENESNQMSTAFTWDSKFTLGSKSVDIKFVEDASLTLRVYVGDSSQPVVVLGMNDSFSGKHDILFTYINRSLS